MDAGCLLVAAQIIFVALDLANIWGSRSTLQVSELTINRGWLLDTYCLPTVVDGLQRSSRTCPLLKAN